MYCNNATFVFELLKLMLFDYKNQHFNCFAHILHLAVQDLLKVLKLEDNTADEIFEVIESDNESVDDIGENEDYFKRINQELQIPTFKVGKFFQLLKKSEQWQNKLNNSYEPEEEIQRSDQTENKTLMYFQHRSAHFSTRDKLFKHYNKWNWIYCSILILDSRHKVE